MPPNSSQLASAQVRNTDGLNTENFGKIWTLKKEERALSVRLSIASTPSEYALLLQETEHLDPVIFEAQFHLTKREAEVLLWLSPGKAERRNRRNPWNDPQDNNQKFGAHFR